MLVNTWSRLIGNTLKESCLDHIYTNDSSSITNLNNITPIMGDHLIVTASLGETKPKPNITERRSWKNYTKSGLINLLEKINFDLEITSVQDLSNEIENKIITVVDKIAPITKFSNNRLEDTNVHPFWLKRKINLRKKLMKKLKSDKSQETKMRIKHLSTEIKSHFVQEKRLKVRQGIKPGNSKSLWEAVKIAKDQNIEELPDQMKFNGNTIPNENLAEEFAYLR